MTEDVLLHMLALGCAFGAVACGSFGLLLQVTSLGLWPIAPGPGRSGFREFTSRLGAIAAARGWFAPLSRSAQRDLVRARLIDLRPEHVVGESMLYGLAAVVSVWALTVALGGAVWNLVPAVVAALIAFQVPRWNLQRQAERRIRRLGRALPYSLEVVVLATETGAGFEEALEILVREDPLNPLHEEFDQVLRDSRFGLTRREAMHALHGRVGTEDIGSLIMAMDIADDLGTPIADTLRNQAESLRTGRLNRAERLAREAGPKMAVPNTMIMVANVLLILAPFLPKLSLSGL